MTTFVVKESQNTRVVENQADKTPIIVLRRDEAPKVIERQTSGPIGPRGPQGPAGEANEELANAITELESDFNAEIAARIAADANLSNRIQNSASGGGTRDLYTQSNPSAIWSFPYAGTIPPNVMVVDSSMKYVVPDIDIDTGTKTITVTFGAPVSGYAYLS